MCTTWKKRGKKHIASPCLFSLTVDEPCLKLPIRPAKSSCLHICFQVSRYPLATLDGPLAVSSEIDMNIVFFFFYYYCLFVVIILHSLPLIYQLQDRSCRRCLGNESSFQFSLSSYLEKDVRNQFSLIHHTFESFLKPQCQK